MKEILNDFIENLKSNVPGFVAVSVTDVSSGEAYDSFTKDESFDPNLASAYNLEVVKAKLKAIEALGLNEEIQDITITLSSQIHIINIAPSGAYFVYLAVDSKDANLGITKALLNKYKVDLNNAL
ncbi:MULTISPECIES: hypothetical protein [Tenacibaculum]|uniref:Roadblock/LAMTOR2 domain-containing protein n=2 Tax=Tenacibaculum TaxID=104267 RepID=A0AAE9MMU7_9FLAO|nr:MULTISPECIES: hypothetical protein [Tenacibaculum]GFD76535.1 hypothetical protein KUL113_59550 [Tenacibaculum sp. KUL113]GFD82795.1 hypothetical protein KUL118_56570 [Tenacibaculum sp. KUL118]GFD93026.1 hypothetical protein KUL154_17590 [Alteromonas sp. KUL154]GFE01899.1 hypothetical protein KUL156_44910 [Alteromonas sp. KUL156]AZJ31702.1 hypothetical protein D6200_03640 [Tenacibaculum mesophilum]